MNVDELRQLMAAIAASDRRTIGKADVDFWAAMAREGDWTLAAAMRAVIQFRANRPGDWLEPGHITGIIRDARHKAANSFIAPRVPDEIRGWEYPVWYRVQLTAHITQVMDAWSAGEPITEQAELEACPRRLALAAGPDFSTCPEELREKFMWDMTRAGRVPRASLAPTRLRRQPPDPERMAAARAEVANLAARRAVRNEGESA